MSAVHPHRAGDESCPFLPRRGARSDEIGAAGSRRPPRPHLVEGVMNSEWGGA